MYCALKDLLGNKTVYAHITETTSYCWSGTRINSPFETDFTFNRYELQYELDQDEWEKMMALLQAGF